MKVSELFLVLSCVFCASADVLHEDLYISGCSDTDGEVMYSLDGEELWYADFINKTGVEPQPSFVDHMSYEGSAYQQAVASRRLCTVSLRWLRRVSHNVSLEQDPPDNVLVYTRDHLNHGVNNTLICYVTGFYPAPVDVYWTKNGQNVTEGTDTSVPHLNKDGFFSQFSRLQFVPHRGDLYGCTVDHPALDRPLTRFWDVKVKPGRTRPVVFWGLCLTAALLAVLAAAWFLIVQLTGSETCC